jgi:hypothetical protein
MCGEPSVARSGLELGQVEPVTGHRLEHEHPARPTVWVEVQRHPQCRVDRTTFRPCRDMGDGPLLSRQRAFHQSHSSIVPHPGSHEVWTRRLETPAHPSQCWDEEGAAGLRLHAAGLVVEVGSLSRSWQSLRRSPPRSRVWAWTR